jgi:hypothetical protein
MTTTRSGRQHLFIIVLVISIIAIAIQGAAVEDQEVEIVSFTEGGLVRGDWEFNVTVRWWVSEVTMTIDEGTAIVLGETLPGNYSIVLDTTSIPDGVHEVTVRAVDDGGYSDEVNLSLDIDNTPPEIEVAWPIDTNITHPFNVGVSFHDAHSDEAMAWVESVDMKFPLNLSEAGFNGIVNIQLLYEGVHDFRVVVVDGAGNEATSESETLQIRKLADLAIDYFQIHRGEPSYVPDRIQVYFEIRNIGYEEVGSFSVDLLVKGRTHDSLVFSEGLAVNRTLAGTFNWSSDESGRYTLGILVDPENEVEELNNENNQDEGSFDYNEFTGCSVLGLVLPLICIQLAISTKGKSTARIT